MQFIKKTGGGGGGTGSAHVIKDEGVALPQRAALNFTGSAVTVTDDAGNNATVVDITGGGASKNYAWFIA